MARTCLSQWRREFTGCFSPSLPASISVAARSVFNLGTLIPGKVDQTCWRRAAEILQPSPDATGLLTSSQVYLVLCLRKKEKQNKTVLH